jgi:hypothetical protein
MLSLTPRFSAVASADLETSRFNGFLALWRGETPENR